MLKIILADNQAIFRTGVAKVLAVEDDLRIVAQADSSEKMMMALEKFHASVMIFGTDLQANLLSHRPIDILDRSRSDLFGKVEAQVQ